MSDSATAHSDNTMHVQPDAFVLGWRKLPDELRVQILGYALASDLYLSSHSFSGNMGEMPERHLSLPTHIQPILACPEIATIALEVLYQQNILFLNVFARSPLVLPPKHFRKFVHSLRVGTAVNGLCFTQLKTLFSPSLGFPLMDNITLHIWSASRNPKHRCRRTDPVVEAMDTMSVNTKELTITYKPAPDPFGLFYNYSHVPLKDDFDSVLYNLFTLAGEQEDVKKTHGWFVRQFRTRVVNNNPLPGWPAISYARSFVPEARLRFWR